jgi:5'-nucleotidase
MTELQPPLILVTNDDGISSPGLRAAADAVLDLGEVWAVAPQRQQSGQGRSFPPSDVVADVGTVCIRGISVPSIGLDASPAQAVRNAMLRFLPRLPRLVVSGINYGENLGACVTISGTVGAALEAAGFGVPAIAASLETDEQYHFHPSSEVDFSAAAAFVRRLAQHLLVEPLPKGVDIMKLDVPRTATEQTPWRMTRVSRQQYFYSAVDTDKDGVRSLRGYSRHIDWDTLEPDSDIYAFAADRVVAVSPLTIDLTAKVDLGELAHTMLEPRRF